VVLPVVAGLISCCCFPIDLSLGLFVGLLSLSEVVFRTPSALNRLVAAAASSGVRSFLDAEPTVLDLGAAAVVVVLATGDELFVGVKRLVEVTWFDARTLTTGLSFLPGDVGGLCWRSSALD